jgi:hypothetical protein
MQALVQQGYQLTIVSHRSYRPYAGPPYDLHAAAKLWVRQNLQTAGLFLDERLDTRSQPTVSFLPTREDKLAKIEELECKVFMDDLPELLDASVFQRNTIPILFAPDTEEGIEIKTDKISAWEQLPVLLSNLT